MVARIAERDHIPSGFFRPTASIASVRICGIDKALPPYRLRSFSIFINVCHSSSVASTSFATRKAARNNIFFHDIVLANQQILYCVILQPDPKATHVLIYPNSERQRCVPQNLHWVQDGGFAQYHTDNRKQYFKCLAVSRKLEFVRLAFLSAINDPKVILPHSIHLSFVRRTANILLNMYIEHLFTSRIKISFEKRC